jgi:hypothetical protein
MGFPPVFLLFILLVGFICLGMVHILGCISFLRHTKPPIERTHGTTIAVTCFLVLSIAIAVALDAFSIIAR